MFKGTKTTEPGEFSRIVSENGGQDNAFTSFDYTGYFQRVSADRLELMMELEADRMQNLVLTEEEVAPERKVILEERAQRTDNDPGALFSEQRQAALYMNHPYGIPIIGWRHEMETLTLEDALDWYETYYAPNNVILIVAGDVDPDEVKALAEKHYGPIPPSETLPERFRTAEPPHRAERRLVYRDDRVRQPYVIRTYLAPERNAGDQKDAAALVMLSELLGGSGITSFFGNRLQLEENVALSTGAFYDGMGLDAQTFGMYIVPVPGVTLEEAEARLDVALADFIETGVDADHLARIKTQIRAAEIFGRDNQQRAARRMGAALTSGLEVEDVLTWPDELAAVTEEDILRVAGMIFRPENSVTGWLTGETDTMEVSQ